MIFEESVLLHLRRNVGQEHEREEPNEELALEILLRRNRCPPHVQPFLEIAEGLLDKVLGPIELECLQRILDVIGNQDEVPIVALGKMNGILLGDDADPAHWSRRDIVVLSVQLFMLGVVNPRSKFFLKRIKEGIEGRLVINRPLVVEIQVQVKPSCSGFNYPRSLLRFPIGPVDRTGMKVDLEIRIVVRSRAHGFPNLVEYGLHHPKGLLHSDQELVMMLIQRVDIVFAVKSPVHDEHDLVEGKEGKITEQLLYGRYVADVPHPWRANIIEEFIKG